LKQYWITYRYLYGALGARKEYQRCRGIKNRDYKYLFCNIYYRYESAIKTVPNIHIKYNEVISYLYDPADIGEFQWYFA